MGVFSNREQPHEHTFLGRNTMGSRKLWQVAQKSEWIAFVQAARIKNFNECIIV